MGKYDIVKEKLEASGAYLLIGAGVVNSLPEILAERNIKKVFLVADGNTYEVAGQRVAELFEKSGIKVSIFTYGYDRLEPNENAVGLAAMQFDYSADAIVGVGSGVINDICKILSKMSGKLYAIVATAPSMDGYASATSSMCVDGLKKSLQTKCPDIIVGDTEILQEAPIKMMLSGLGDMLAKYVAICEWRISAIINDEAFSDEIANMVRSSLKTCIDNADGLLSRSADSVESVFSGLVLTGAAMNIAGSSRPASGGEHYISHIIDMRSEEFGTPSDFHGIQCAIATYISVAVYEKIKTVIPDKNLALKYVSEFDYSKWSSELKEFLGRSADAMIALEQTEKKYDASKHSVRLERIIEKWHDIIAVINQELPTLVELEALYDKVGLPKRLDEIGVATSMLPLIFKSAKDIRDKYVLPRLCFDLGIIDQIW